MSFAEQLDLLRIASILRYSARYPSQINPRSVVWVARVNGASMGTGKVVEIDGLELL